MGPDVDTVLRCYPQIYFACHKRHVRDQATNEVISAHQASILDHLDDVQATSLFDLARHMGVTASTMSITVDRLVRGDSLVPAPTQQDRPPRPLPLTPLALPIHKH